MIFVIDVFSTLGLYPVSRQHENGCQHWQAVAYGLRKHAHVALNVTVV